MTSKEALAEARRAGSRTRIDEFGVARPHAAEARGLVLRFLPSYERGFST